MLITGGLGVLSINEKQLEDGNFFQFNESAWDTITDEVKEFVAACLEKDSRKRPSINRLMQFEFIRLHKNSALDK